MEIRAIKRRKVCAKGWLASRSCTVGLHRLYLQLRRRLYRVRRLRCARCSESHTVHVSTCSFNRKPVLSYNCSDVFKIRPMQQKTGTNTNTENANNLPWLNQTAETEAAQELCKSCSKTVVYVLCGRLQRAWEWTGREQIGKKRSAGKRKSNFCHRAEQITVTQHPPRPCQQVSSILMARVGGP